jgi:DNA-binding sugar fermentation-stimulating protein
LVWSAICRRCCVGTSTNSIQLFRIVDEGKERHVEARRIDILAEDDDGSLVAIELKSRERRYGA